MNYVLKMMYILIIMLISIEGLSASIVGATKGEFSTNQGQAQYQLKIAVPPGVAGIKPVLSLSYSSIGGNGYMGQGWSLDGVSTITRCAQTKAVDGVNHKFGVKYNSDDKFCLDGQRLVSVSDSSPFGAPVKEYRTEINNYSKIIAEGTYKGGPRYFNVYTKNGLRYIYGAKSSTYMKYSGTPIVSWKIDRIIDTFGNTISFTYNKDVKTGSSSIAKVTYVDNTIQYIYETRKDKITGYSNGYPYEVNKRLKTIIVKTGSREIRRYSISYKNNKTGVSTSQVTAITEHVPEGNLRPLRFTNTPTSTGGTIFGTKKSWIQDFGTNQDILKYPRQISDVNGDGFPDIVAFADVGVVVSLNKGNNSFAPRKDWVRGGFGFQNGWREGKDIRLVEDVNGDGLGDIIGFGENGVYVALSTGKNFTKIQRWSAEFSSKAWRNTLFIRTLSDMNGDGLPDLVGFGWTGVYVALNTGHGFAKAKTWTKAFASKDWQNTGFIRTLSDVNGDGLPDIIGFGWKSVVVALNNGHGFSGAKRWTNDFTTEKWQNKNFIRTLSDVNGDGLPDIIGFGHTGVQVGINTGKGFKKSIKWISDFGTQKGYDISKHIRTLADVDGDGLNDIVAFANNAVYVGLNNGHGFNKAIKAADASFTYSQCWRVGINQRGLPDMNLDGLPDIIGFGGDAVYVGLNQRKHSLLTRINNNTNQDIQIEYKPMKDKAVYYNYTTHGKRNVYGFNKISNDNIELTTSMPLVYRVKHINGVKGYSSMRYFYYGYIYNKLRGTQGFHAINTYDETRKNFSQIYYRQIAAKDGTGFQYTGMPSTSLEDRDIKYNPNSVGSRWLSRTDIIYKDASKYSKIYEPYTYSNVEKIYDPDSRMHKSSIYRYNTISKDGLGNIVKVVNRTKDEFTKKIFDKVIINEYKTEDIHRWIIGRLTKSTTTHTQTDGGTVRRAATFKYNAYGILSEEVVNAGTALALKKNYKYDKFGNKIQERISGKNIITATTRFGYSKDHKFQTSITNAAGIRTTKTFDVAFGTVKSVRNPNGTSTFKYDGLGRKTEEHRADGSTTRWLYKWYKKGVLNTRYLYYVVEITSGMPNKYLFYDSLGRSTTAYTTELGGKRLRTMLKYYTSKGELDKEALPYIEGKDSVKFVDYTYDKYGRLIKTQKPGPNGKTQTSSLRYMGSPFGRGIKETLPSGVTKFKATNAIGQTVRISDMGKSATSISYKYDAAGQLIQTKDAKNNIITMKYDSAGNKVYMNDPDLGIWQYRYNPMGQLRYQWSGVGTTNESHHFTYNIYDVLGRLVRTNNYDRKVYLSSSKKDYTYNYKTFKYSKSTGRVSKAYASSKYHGKEWHGEYMIPTYDKIGRVIKSDKFIYGSGHYISKMTYDNLSRVNKLTYPNGYSITNHYKNGILDFVKGSDGKVHYKINKLSALGQVEQAQYANGVKTMTGYNDAGFAKSIISYTSTALVGNIQRLDYNYDIMGNVIKRDDTSITGKHISDSYGYDKADRLIFQRTDSNVIGNYRKSVSYEYDSIGNMTYQTGIGFYNYYSKIGKPHAVKSIGMEPFGINPTRKYTYDAIGNVIDRNGDKISYTPHGKVATITGKNSKTVNYYYGIGDKRYIKKTKKSTIYYVGKGYEEEVEGSQKKQTCYISIGGKTIGTHVEKIDDTYSINKKNPKYKQTYNRYFHMDALGSITAVTDDKAKVIERRSYDAFGKIRAMDYGLTNNHAIIPQNSVVETTRAYTGHEQIKEIEGLIHMNARVYDSEIGRFLSADTVIQDPLDSQAYNRYSYVRNNPLKYTDPTGHWGGWLGKQLRKAGKWVDKHVLQPIKNSKVGRVVVGVTLIVIGVAIGLGTGGVGIGVALKTAASIALMSGGTSLANYDPNDPNSNLGFHTEITIQTGGDTSTADEQAKVDNLAQQSEAIDRANAGVAPTSASPVTNDNYAGGIPMSADGIPILRLSANAQSAEASERAYKALMNELSSMGDVYYEMFTYTNIGGVIDVGYQYYNDDIGGWYAAGLLVAEALGGKAAGKGYAEGVSRYTAYTRLRDTTEASRKNTNYAITTRKEEFIRNLEYNGYRTENGYKYSKEGSKGYYDVYNSRSSNGFPGAKFSRSRHNYTKYSLGAPDYEFY